MIPSKSEVAEFLEQAVTLALDDGSPGQEFRPDVHGDVDVWVDDATGDLIVSFWQDPGEDDNDKTWDSFTYRFRDLDKE